MILQQLYNKNEYLSLLFGAKYHRSKSQTFRIETLGLYLFLVIHMYSLKTVCD